MATVTSWLKFVAADGAGGCAITVVCEFNSHQNLSAFDTCLGVMCYCLLHGFITTEHIV